VHFYHLHASTGDVVSALKADPKKTSELAQSISNWPKSSPVLLRPPKRLIAFVDSGQLGIFANGYWPLRLPKLPPEANLMGRGAPYREALEWQKEMVKSTPLFGGKTRPELPGGRAPCSFNLDESNAINADAPGVSSQALPGRPGVIEQG